MMDSVGGAVLARGQMGACFGHEPNSKAKDVPKQKALCHGHWVVFEAVHDTGVVAHGQEDGMNHGCLHNVQHAVHDESDRALCRNWHRG